MSIKELDENQLSLIINGLGMFRDHVATEWDNWPTTRSETYAEINELIITLTVEMVK
jgi:hypothetical protein